MIHVGQRGVHYDTCPACWGARSSGSGPWHRGCGTCRSWGIIFLPGASFDLKTRYGIIPKEVS